MIPKYPTISIGVHNVRTDAQRCGGNTQKTHGDRISVRARLDQIGGEASEAAVQVTSWMGAGGLQDED